MLRRPAFSSTVVHHRLPERLFGLLAPVEVDVHHPLSVTQPRAKRRRPDAVGLREVKLVDPLTDQTVWVEWPLAERVERAALRVVPEGDPPPTE